VGSSARSDDVLTNRHNCTGSQCISPSQNNARPSLCRQPTLHALIVRLWLIDAWRARKDGNVLHCRTD